MSVEKHFCNKKNKCKVVFHLPLKATKSKNVKVVGEFNNWDIKNAIPMEIKNGEFIAETELPIDATYQYRYIIDDQEWENDWDADAYFSTEYGVDNSVVDTHLEETVQGLKHFMFCLFSLTCALILFSACNKSSDPCTEITWYEDADGDGLGNPDVSIAACEQPNGYVANATDENDSGSSSPLTVNNYLLVSTGQVETYDNSDLISGLIEGDVFYGQDAHYLNDPAMSYQDNMDGTVTDLNTGLMWQQVPSSSTYTWQEAVDHCENLTLNGYDDWRIPSLKELYSISDFGTGWPYLDTDYFTLASGIINKDEQYWSSNYYVGTTEVGGTESAFGVNHVTGHIKSYAANISGQVGGKYVRAVRGDNYGINDFVDNSDGTITDEATGLMWMQADNGEGVDWEAALAYAENFEFAGYTDWRLPNVKELQSLVDYSYSPTAHNSESLGPAINPLFSCTPIVNEAGNDDYGYCWTNTSARFEEGGDYYYAWYVAFGMAVNGDGIDSHGAGGVRFDTKVEGGPAGEGGERYYNYVRLVRDK